MDFEVEASARCSASNVLFLESFGRNCTAHIPACVAVCTAHTKQSLVAFASITAGAVGVFWVRLGLEDWERVPLLNKGRLVGIGGFDQSSNQSY